MADEFRAVPTRKDIAIRDFFDLDHAGRKGALVVGILVVAGLGIAPMTLATDVADRADDV